MINFLNLKNRFWRGMKNSMQGFYYHYKRSPDAPVTEGAYEVLGTAFNTEVSGPHSSNPKDFEQTEVVVYRPLFTESLVYTAGKRFWIRPLSMFLENVEHNGKQVPRFQKISDQKTIDLLTDFARKLYC